MFISKIAAGLGKPLAARGVHDCKPYQARSTLNAAIPNSRIESNRFHVRSFGGHSLNRPQER